MAQGARVSSLYSLVKGFVKSRNRWFMNKWVFYEFFGARLDRGLFNGLIEVYLMA